MISDPPVSLPDALEALARATGLVRAAAGSVDAGDAVAGLLRGVDVLTVAAAGLVASGGIERDTGLPSEMGLQLFGRLVSWDARGLAATVDALGRMPITRGLVLSGRVSWSQARAICREASDLSAEGRGELDALVGRLAESAGAADPDDLVRAAADRAFELREAREARREARTVEQSFLMVQGRLGGGGRLYGEADVESFAAIVEALDAASDRPVNADKPAGPSRAAQRMGALVRICEQSLAGGGSAGAWTRPRPRLVASIDIDAADEAGIAAAARVLWSLSGRAPRLSRLATEMLLCDAEVVPVVFADGTPLAAGDAQQTVSPKLRAALIARDGGCRFPGCRAPVGWTDAHHLVARSEGGKTTIENLVLLCRRCHRRVHAQGWQLRWRGWVLEASLRGRRLESWPRTRPPPGA